MLCVKQMISLINNPLGSGSETLQFRWVRFKGVHQSSVGRPRATVPSWTERDVWFRLYQLAGRHFHHPSHPSKRCAIHRRTGPLLKGVYHDHTDAHHETCWPCIHDDVIFNITLIVILNVKSLLHGTPSLQFKEQFQRVFAIPCADLPFIRTSPKTPVIHTRNLFDCPNYPPLRCIEFPDVLAHL